MLLNEQATTELRELSEEAARRLAEIDKQIEEERAALKKSLEAIDKKYRQRVARACLAVGVSGIALGLLVWAANNRIQQANVGDATPPAPRIVDDGLPPETTEIGGTIVPKGTFKNGLARVAQSVVMVYNADGQCSASVIGQKKLSSAAHCEIALGDTVYVPSTGQFTTVVGVAPAAEGDVVIVQTDQNLRVPPLKINAPEYQLTIDLNFLGTFKFKTPWNLPFSEKLKTTEDVAIIGFPGLKIFQRARQGQEALNTETKRYAFPAYADNTRLSHDSTAATGSVPEELLPYSAPDPETFTGGMSGGPAVDQQGEIVGLASEASNTRTTRMLGRNLQYIQTVDTSAQFCTPDGKQVPLEHLLAMQFTGMGRCS
jgi:hypothetical protein